MEHRCQTCRGVGELSSCPACQGLGVVAEGTVKQIVERPINGSYLSELNWVECVNCLGKGAVPHDKA